MKDQVDCADLTVVGFRNLLAESLINYGILEKEKSSSLQHQESFEIIEEATDGGV